MATKTYNIDINVQSKTLGELEDQLAEINEELKQVDRNSDAFKDLTKQAQATEKELAKVNKQIEGFTAEDKFMAADGAIKAFAGSLSGAVGLMAAFGIESEAFADFEKQAIGAIALGVGLKDISEGYRQLSLSFKAATGAQLGFNAATLANPYIAAGAAIVAVIGSIVVQFEAFSNVLKEAGLGTIDLSGAWEKFQDFFAGATTAIAKTAGKLVAGMAALFRLDFKEAGKQLGGISVKEDFNEGVITRRTKRIEDQAKKDAEAYELTRQERLKELQAQWAFEEELQGVSDEINNWFEEEGRKAGISFSDAFNKTVKSEDGIDLDAIPDFVDIDRLEDEEKFFEDMDKRAEAKQKQLELDELQRQSRLQLLSVIEDTAEKETAIGKAAFLARQAVLFQELTLETKMAMARMLSTAGEASVNASAGFLETAKAGFPKNIPLLIAYGIQVAALLSNVKQALGTAKAGTAAASVQAPTVPTIAPPAEINQIPEIEAAQPAIRAYVVAGDTRSAAEAEAKIETRRTFGS